MNVVDDADLRFVETLDDALELKRWLGERRDSMVCIDTETTGLDRNKDKVRLFQIGDSQVGWAMAAEDWRALIREVISSQDELGTWNATYDQDMLTRLLGKDCTKKLHDGSVLSHLDDPIARRGLKASAARHVDPRALNMDEMLHRKMGEHKWTWATVPIDFPPYWVYGAVDCVLTSAAIGKLLPLAAERSQLELYELELQAARVCARMSRKGIRVDDAYAREQVEVLEDEVIALRQWCKDEYGFEIGTKASVVGELKRAGWVPYLFTEKGQPSLSKDGLAGFDHPLAKAYVRKEAAQRLAHTYFARGVEMVDEHGRIHVDINPLQAKTGRMSVGGLSIQNQPRGSYVRRMFVAGEGCKFVMADFAQIEMRLFAHFARETRIIAFYRQGLDMPNEVARTFYYPPGYEGAVQATQRQAIKSTLYSLIYGAGADTIAKVAGLDDGRAFLERLYTLFPRIKWFQDEVQKRAVGRDAKRPWVESPRWHRRYFVEDPRKAYKLVNYLLQGEAGIAFKKQLVNLSNVGLDQYMVMPVHDEVVCDVPEADVPDVQAALAQHMPDLDGYSIPLTVEVSQPYDNWGDKYVGFDPTPIAEEED